MNELAEKIDDTEFLEKLHFDCMKEENLNKALSGLEKNTIIIAGMETHVCVFQTALTLLKDGKNVIIASDAVCSRRKHDWDTALRSLSAAGALIYPTETISFMILEKAGTDEFKKLAPFFK
jgi:nicotinamidase-related amidase